MQSEPLSKLFMVNIKSQVSCVTFAIEFDYVCTDVTGSGDTITGGSRDWYRLGCESTGGLSQSVSSRGTGSHYSQSNRTQTLT